MPLTLENSRRGCPVLVLLVVAWAFVVPFARYSPLCA
jgi:hypothetical protein